MKIAFMGKGGSGKTTLTTAFTYYIQEAYRDTPIWLFDADLNSHILDEFGYGNEKIQYLGGDFTTVAQMIEPSILQNKINTEVAGFGTIPPNEKTVFVSPQIESDFSKYYGIKKGNTTFFTIGNYSVKDNPSGKCYHGELNSYELAIHRIKDSNTDYVIADTTAGADNLGTSLYMAYDVVFFIVEPTERSIGVYKDYISLPEVDEKSVFVLANKVEDEDDKLFIQSAIGKENILAYFAHDDCIYEPGTKEHYEAFIEKNIQAFGNIDTVASQARRDEQKYYNQLYSLFIKEAQGWYNSASGMDLLQVYPKK